MTLVRLINLLSLMPYFKVQFQFLVQKSYHTFAYYDKNKTLQLTIREKDIKVLSSLRRNNAKVTFNTSMSFLI